MKERSRQQKLVAAVRAVMAKRKREEALLIEAWERMEAKQRQKKQSAQE